MEKSNKLTQTHRKKAKINIIIMTRKRKNIENKTKERVKRNRSI